MKDITIEQILSLLPKSVTLHYVDKNDSLDNFTEIIQECISNGNLDRLYERVDDWYVDDYYAMDCITDELKSAIGNAFDLDENEAEDLYNKHEEAIKDAIYERDDSDVVRDLFRNTNDYVMFYDTGHYVECTYPCTHTTYLEQLEEIKKIIKLNSNDYDKNIRQMMYQASYGGNLVIYFRKSGLDVLQSIESGANLISFSGEVNIAISNHSCGAGGHTRLKHSFSLPFDKSNLFLCKEVKYSYTYEVCGMSSNWCESTEMTLSKTDEELEEVVISSTSEHVAREARLDAVYKAGGCTAGDMKYERHRNLTYRNDYPCGNTCGSCGTFFID